MTSRQAKTSKGMHRFSMQDEVLIEFTQVTDDSTGIWTPGEVEYGIHGSLTDFLKNYGRKGRDELIEMLETMKGIVGEYFDDAVKEKGKELSLGDDSDD